MEYRSDKKSIIYSLLKRTILIILLSCIYHPIFGIVVSLIYTIISYNIYKHMSVFLNNNFLIINGIKNQKSINLNDLTLQKYYRGHRKGYWLMGKYKEFDSPSSLPLHKVLWFKYNDDLSKEENIILNFLSDNDFIDIKRRIFAHQNKTENYDLQNSIRINTNHESYIIDKENIKKDIDKIYNKCLIYTILSIILSISVILSIHLVFTHSYNEVINMILYIIILFSFSLIGINFNKIIAWNYLRQIKDKFINKIIIEDKIIIGNKIIEFRDIRNIYTNTYSDILENEIKCLVISTEQENYTYYLDYVIDNDEKFILFNNMCSNLKNIFGKQYSNNNI